MMASLSDRVLEGDRFILHPKVTAIAKVFVKVPDTQIWLTKFPAGFLRGKGPVAEPNDPIIRVDLVSGGASRLAKPAETRTSLERGPKGNVDLYSITKNRIAAASTTIAAKNTSQPRCSLIQRNALDFFARALKSPCAP
jgi:hypothetical protein